MKKLFNTMRGSIMLEAALTFPIIIYIILFSLEMVHLQRVQTSIDAIAEACTIDYITYHDSSRFTSIINEYLSSTDRKHLMYSFTVYESLEKMSEAAPYGGTDICWPGDTSSYIATTSTQLKAVGYIVDNVQTPEANQAVRDKIPGCAFVLTFVFDYNFFSHLTRALFSGGSNTTDKKKYLLWARGVGICEYKYQK